MTRHFLSCKTFLHIKPIDNEITLMWVFAANFFFVQKKNLQVFAKKSFGASVLFLHKKYLCITEFLLLSVLVKKMEFVFWPFGNY